MSQRAACLALAHICEPGDARLPEFLREHGPADLLGMIRRGRRVNGRTVPAAWVQAAESIDADVERSRRLADAAGLRWVIPGDSEWPDHVGDLDHASPNAGVAGAPVGLWIRGTGRLSDLVARSVAIVGARDCTAYGAEQAAEIAADAASAGFTVVSGAAFGIDACAHRGALVMASPTVAVLACDAATSYPRAHAALLERIAADGVIVSEQPPRRVPTKARFLSRNRLIAGLTAGTVVVEARRRSGALNTLAWADQLGRVTMAVPGPVTSPQSVGTHAAIRDGKAMLVASGSDVVAALAGIAVPSPEPTPASSRADTAFDRLSADQSRVLDALDWTAPLAVEEVARRAGVARAVAVRALDVLRRQGWVATDRSSAWLLVRRADVQPDR